MYCEICKKDYHNLSNHLILKHKISPKDYFDEYLKTEENSHCILCHAELKDFRNRKQEIFFYMHLKKIFAYSHFRQNIVIF